MRPVVPDMGGVNSSAGTVLEPPPVLPARVESLEWERRYIERIRQVVGDEDFRGVPLHLTVHSFLVLLLRRGHLKGPGCTPGGAALALARALAHPHGWWGVRRPAPRQWARLQRRVLVAGLHPQDRLRRWWQSLAEALGPDRCLLLAAGRSLLNQPPLELPRLAVTDFPAAWLATRVWVVRRLPRWLSGLRAVCAELGFDPPARWRLAADLVSQVNRLGSILALDKHLQPRALVVPWDREPFSAALCAALGTRGVPTVTFVHGAFGVQNHGGFLPLGARYLFTWGEVQNELLGAAGVARERLLPVGVLDPRPVRRAPAPSERAARLGELGLEADKPVVLVGLTCLTERDRPVWARLLQGLSAQLTGAVVLARLHPSNSRAHFADLLPGTPRLQVVDDRQLSAAQSLDLADAVLVDSSSFGLDAIQRRIPVVALWPPDGSGLLTVMREAVMAGAALFARDVAEAAQVLACLLTDATARASVAERAEAFTNRYVCAYGPEAVSRALAALTRLETAAPADREAVPRRVAGAGCVAISKQAKISTVGGGECGA